MNQRNALRMLWLGVCLAWASAGASGQPPQGMSSGCTAVTLRSGPGKEPPLPALCHEGPKVPRDGAPRSPLHLRWLASVADEALTAAELQSCGVPGCLGHGRTVRLILMPDVLPSGTVLADAVSLDFVFSEGIADIVEATALTLFIESSNSDRRQREGIGAWFEALENAGGMRCDQVQGFIGERVPAPRWPEGAQTFAKLLYQFLMAHELAHHLQGDDCGSRSSDQFEIESACDQLAVKQVTPADGSLVPLVTMFLSSLHHYEQLFSARWGPALREGDGEQELFEALPARNWQGRARRLIEPWMKICREDSKDSRCKHLWGRSFEIADAFSRFPLPLPCRLGGGTTLESISGPWSAEANACLHDVLSDEFPSWNVRPTLVAFRRSYQNACPRRIACAITIDVGTVPEMGPGAWVPFRHLKRQLELEPGEVSSVQAILRWKESPYLRPSLHYPTRHDLSLARCGFKGPRVEFISGITPFCKALGKALDSGEEGFVSIWGKQASADQSVRLSDHEFVRQGEVLRCRLNPATEVTPPYLSCVVAEAKGPGISFERIERVYHDWREKLQACLAKRLWQEQETNHTTASYAMRYANYERVRGTLGIELTLTQALLAKDSHAVYFRIKAPKHWSRKPEPKPANPRQDMTVRSFEEAVTVALQRLRDPDTLPRAGYIWVRLPTAGADPEDEEDSFDREDYCSPPEMQDDPSGCRVTLSCRTRPYLRRPGQQRFQELVSHFESVLTKEAGWKPVGQQKAFISDKYSQWRMYHDKTDRWFLMEADDFPKGIRLELHADHPAGSPVCHSLATAEQARP